MGRKNRKDKSKTSYTSRSKSKLAYKSRISSELQEHINYTKNGYFSVLETFEVMDCIKFFKHWIWCELNTSTSHPFIIGEETIQEILADDDPPETIIDNMDLILTLLTAESLRKGFSNVLLYARFLRSCCLEIYGGSGNCLMRDWDEHPHIKKWVHVQWMLRKKYDICVGTTNEGASNEWEVPEV